jgi:catechol 2,3-dioxygenase-like lactoylglutathione lyase family enzyme
MAWTTAWTTERQLDRRSFLLALPAILLAPSLLAATRGLAPRRRALSALALNHVELAVSDVGRSVEFYEAVLGTPVQARREGATILRLGAGPQFMALRAVAAGEAPSLARMGIAVDGFDIEGVIPQLEDAGLALAGSSMPSELAMRIWTGDRRAGDGVRDLYLADPNGLVVQVVDRRHCGGDGPLGSSCGAAVPAPDGIMRAVDLNHFTSSVSSPEASVEFFQRVFGLPIQAYQAATPALGIAAGPQFLMFTGGGAAAGGPVRGDINHVCMTVEDFDVERILSDLAAFGISARGENEGANVPFRSSVSLRMPNRGGAPGGTPEVYFTDPDGLRIQVQDPTYCGGGGVLGSECG